MSRAFRCGFVGLVGPTNSGKSTFLNTLLGEKLSIVSSRPQTTLRSVRGVWNGDSTQVIFVDLPGLQKKLQSLSGALNKLAKDQALQCDKLLWFFDVSNRNCLRQIEQMKSYIPKWKPQKDSICLLNKVDRIDKRQLLPMIARLAEMEIFEEVIPISAIKNDGLEKVAHLLGAAMPEGPALFPEHMITDRDADFRIAELVREKIYQVTRQEIPYSVWIEVESVPSNTQKDVPSFLGRIHADSESRKRILVGKGGEVVKSVGMRARQEVEALLGKQVCLKLQVDVDPEWRKNKSQVKAYLELR